MDNNLQQNIEEKVFFKIIIPNYNNMPYIKKCLDSILEQTFQDFKIIIVDDMSTDLSDKFCEMYARKYPDKIIYHRLAIKGYAGMCRNWGLQYTNIQCKYILFVDSDDWMYDDSILKQIYDSVSPDIKIIKMPMYHFYGINDKRNFIKTFNSNITIEESFYNGCGPGRTCISSDLATCLFKERRRIANDVIWYMRCIDNIVDINNILSLTFPCQVYNCASVTSGTNLIKKNKKTKQYISQMALLLNDLKHETFKNNIVKNIQRQLILKYEKELFNKIA